MAALDALLADAGDQHGGLAVVEGPAGIGKSRLLAEMRARAAGRSMRVLAATATELGQSVPFGVVHQLFGSVAARDRADATSGAASLAVPLFDAEPHQEVAQAAALPLFHGLYWLTANLAERRPVHLSVDDAHWADRPSLGFLLYLAQRVKDLPVALVVGLRTGEPDAPEDLLARLAGHRLAHVFSLAPLSRAATEALVHSRLATTGPGVVDACHAATGGNPFLLRSLLEELGTDVAAPSAETVRRVAGSAPESVLRSVVARLRRLPMPARQAADAVAVLGGDATLSRVAAVAGLRADVASSGVDALVAANLLVVREAGTVAFRHPLVRSAVYRDLVVAARGAAHATAARLLHAAGEPSERVAAHLLAAPPAGDATAVTVLRSAARRAVAEGDPAAAVRYLERALAEPPPAPDRLDVLMALGRAEALSGAPDAAEHFSAAAGLARDARLRARILLELGRTLYSYGRLAEAAETFERGRSEVAGVDPEIEAELRAGWATVARLDPALRPRVQEELRSLLARGGEVETHGERVLLAHAAEQLVFAGENRDQAVELARRALAGNRLLAEETSDGMVWFLTVGDLGWCDEFDEQEHHIAAGLEDARGRGSVWGFANASYLRAFGSYYRGRIADSIADLESALEAAAYGWEQFLPAVHMQLAWSQMERGDLDAAERTLDSVDGDPRWAQTVMQALVTGARGRLAWMRGRPREALALILDAGRVGVEARMDNPAVMAPWRSWAALAAARLGDSARALELAEEELALATRFGAPRPIGVALRAAGTVRGGHAGLERLEESVTVLERSPAALELARTLLELGRALRRSGRDVTAREPLRRALDMAHRFGALVLERDATRELRATGARPRRSVLSGIDALTPKERRVAEAAARGSTNREIAEDLFVTLKTVEAHLGRAFRKLGLAGREELAEALGRERPGP